jgi:preprotein translocase subunit SecD
VRAFYDHLREKRFRDAIFLTNLRPAVEGLTDAELKEYQLDFEAIAKYVPPLIEINGEIISANKATVTAKLPNEELDKDEIQEIRLRKAGDIWVILTVDEAAEKKIKREGKNYFPALRVETHQDEAKEMLDRVAKAQIAYAAQNAGLYGDMNALIAAHVLPEDIRSSQSTGYLYTVTISADGKRYAAYAVPATYGKTGKNSYAIELDSKGQPHLKTLHDPPTTK